MALDPLELGTIAVILLVFFLWGPQKIPELARVIGQARKEFDNATKEFQRVSTTIQNGTNPLLQPLSAPAAPAAPTPRSALPQAPSSGKTGDQLLIEAARRLGIPTQGKTREQIQQDIISMAQGSKPPPDAPPAPPDGQNPA
ncbi:MAG TPA: twin-arginine translocase TatA/TatE family subunit [Nitrososphaerales archaeon]|nr:twin-arginine translocase TatA/TatE family subunit [Nitrososphaerales archaeon]